MDSENFQLTEVPESENRGRRGHLWCFTLFTRPDKPHVPPTELPPAMSYLVFQEERCPETGRHHYQGFMNLIKQSHRPAAKKVLQKAFSTACSPALFYSNGTVDQNIVYCTKLDSRVPGTWPSMFGEKPTHEVNGKPCSTTMIIDHIMNKKMTVTQALQSPDVPLQVKTYGLRYARTWEHLLCSFIQHRNPDVAPEVIVLYGIPRSGKSKLARIMAPGAYKKIAGTKYWEQYMGQTSVIYEDFDGSSMTPQEFKVIFDRPELLAEKKGGSTPISATKHIITTNVYPSHWWSNKALGQYGREAVWERITQIWYFPVKWRPAIVYDDPLEFRRHPMNFTFESEDPKGNKG